MQLVEIGDAFLGLGARLLLGLGDIDRRRDKDLALTRMTGRLVRLLIGLDVRRQLRPGRVPRAGEYRIAHGADRRKGVRGAGGDADRRQFSVIGARHRSDVVEIVEPSRIGKARLFPGPQDDFEDFGEAVAALFVGHLIGVIGADDATAADAEYEPPLADLIDRRGLFGEAQRMAQRQHLHGDADFHAGRAGGDGAGDRQWRRQIGALGCEMDLSQPHRV